MEFSEVGALCEDTEDLGTISEDVVAVFGSTEEAGYYPFLTNCYRNPIRSRASVYTVKSNSSMVMYASVRQAEDRYFRPQVTVFGGSCDSLQCADNMDQYRSGQDFWWEAEENIAYHIFVYGYNLDQYGEFVLRLEAALVGSVCEEAVDLGVLPIGPLVEAGDTFDAYRYQLPTCYSSVDSPAKVYTMTAQAGRVSARVYGFNLDARMAVYQGDCGDDELECLSSRDSRQTTWEAKDGDQIMIAVHGCCGNDAVGDFVLQIETTVAKNPCDEVVDLGTMQEGGILVRGSTRSGSIHRNLTDCYYYGQGSAAPSVMYTMTGTGETFHATVSSDGYFSPFVAVYEGLCGNLNCTGRYTESTDATWNTVKGKVYHLVIGSLRSVATGDFLLSVKESSSSADACNDAEALGFLTDGVTLRGTTAGMVYAGLPLCYSRITSPAKIYSMEVSSKRIISAAVDGGSLDAYISVYEGSCDGELTCVPGHEWRRHQFEAQPNRTYYIVGAFFLFDVFAIVSHVTPFSHSRLCSNFDSLWMLWPPNKRGFLAAT